MSVSKAICSSCGVENDGDARVCTRCGNDLGPGVGVGVGAGFAGGETRRVVTVLFSDVKGSTALGQELDPESLRRLMGAYFVEMEKVLERHGGTVEKFIGDAVMAVFGVPQLHEDDGLRAVRAAVEMRRALSRLNEEFDRSWGVTLAVRVGVNTGEVIAGDPGGGQSFVVGEAVNVASRLEQAASPGEILIGQTTERLVRDAAVLEEAGELELKGLGSPVRAWRLVDVVAGAVAGWARSDDAPFVGRGRELALLEEALGRVGERGACELLTVLGAAGVGKSRLVREYRATVAGRAAVISGRCLPYGEGITFWPVAGAVREAARISDADSPAEARAKLASLLPADGDGPLVEARLAGLLGSEPISAGVQETFWAVRKLFERLASTGPLVVVFDDIQWAEPTFLDLLEYLADWISFGPVLLVCLARPELHETRPSWSARPGATVVRLEPLSEAESEGLITHLLGGAPLDEEVLARLAGVAEGNPLFLEQTLRMLIDDGVLRRNGRWTVAGDLSALSIPLTVHSVLAARLDRLAPEERRVIERGAVVGRTFWWGAVRDLSPEEERADVGRSLQGLVRKGLIRPDRSELGLEDAFRFAHILVRDAAYQGIPKSVRAELHEHFAEWAEVRTRELAGQFEEIVGYHLEQAYRYQVELGMPTERADAVARRAAALLAAAGSRAFARGDMPAAVKLLSRAAALLPPGDRQRLEVLPPLAFALLETGDFAGLQESAAELTDAAASGDAGIRAHAAVLNLWIRLFTNPEGFVEEAEKQGTAAAAAFSEVGDERGLAKAWTLLALVHVFRCTFGPAEHAYGQAAEHARRAGDRRDELESLAWIPLTIWAGPTAAEPGVVRCRKLLERVEGDSKAVASALIAEAAFRAGIGRFAEARASLAEAKELLAEAALTVWLRGPLAQLAGWSELLAGDAEAAERELRAGYDVLAEIGEVAWLPTVAAILGEAVYRQGRLDEAEELSKVSESVAGPEDVYSQAMWRAVRAKVDARRGESEQARRLVREAVTLTDEADFLHLRWYALMSLAEVSRLAGDEDGARAAAREAIAVAEEKGSTVGAQAARALLERSDRAGT